MINTWAVIFTEKVHFEYFIKNSNILIRALILKVRLYEYKV